VKRASIATVVGLAALLAGTLPAMASNTIARAEGLVCTTCHDKPGSKRLTDQGKYYDLMSSLEGYPEIHEAFGRCTSCHVRKPGSLELTRQGKRFQWMVIDMEGLRELVLGYHPGSEVPQRAPSGEVEPANEEELPGRR
jgi:hypothetical protein